MRYDYAVPVAGGLTTDRSYVDGATAGVGGTLKETVQTQSDWASRTLTTTTAPGTADVGITTQTYNSEGQLEQVDDPDGVTTFYEYNDEGERILTIVDLDGGNSKDAASDRYTLVESNPEKYDLNNTPGDATDDIDVIKTVVTVFPDGATYPAGGVVTSTSRRETNGLRSWNEGISSSIASSQTTVLLGTGDVTQTTVAPDGTYVESTTTDGLLDIVKTFDADDNLLHSTDYVTYDSLNRPTHVKDSRHASSAVTAYYDTNTDVVASVTDAASNTTAYTYDHRGRRLTVNAPDTDKTHDPLDGQYTNVTTTHYFPDGRTKEVTGDQVYRRTYTYDYAQRMKTLTTYGGITATTTWNYSANRGWLENKLDDPAVKGGVFKARLSLFKISLLNRQSGDH